MFSNLIGNERVKDSLAHLVSNGRVPNSLLFTGPEGVGKKQFAFELARSFVCQMSEQDVCGQCPACTRITAFSTPTTEKGEDYDRVFFSGHPDVGLVIPYKRNLRVGAIRALEVQANYRPYEARARVFIIDDADKMTDAASNALLKTLEEPPSTTYLILVTSRPNMLMSTIRSRCQTIRFTPIAAREIERFLVAENSMKPDDAKLAGLLSNGSVAHALELDIGRFRSQRDIQLANIEKALIHSDRSALLRSSEQMNDAKNKALYEENLEILESLIRDVWLIKSREPNAVRNIDLGTSLEEIADRVESPNLVDAMEEIERLRQSFAVNINRRAATDSLFMKMSA